MVENLNLESYEVRVIDGKRLLVSTDGKNSFPFGNPKEQKETIEFFKKVNEGRK